MWNSKNLILFLNLEIDDIDDLRKSIENKGTKFTYFTREICKWQKSFYLALGSKSVIHVNDRYFRLVYKKLKISLKVAAKLIFLSTF